ncbi:MAG: hypothetical protein GF331_03470, partial [Chitinivibrionales bacterium]|nr:hypothetical protein [Chitinivibrionales bacterium]
MRELIRSIRDRLLGTDDTVGLERARLVTEAYREHEGAPAPLRRAHAFAHVLRSMTLDLRTNPVFAGNTSSRPRAWMLIPEHGFGVDAQIALENEGVAQILDEKIPLDIVNYWKHVSVGGTAGIGHLAVDLGRVVHEGLAARIDEAQRHERTGTPESREYRHAMTIALHAVIDWAHRYAAQADSAAAEEPDPLVRGCLSRIARACRHVPEYPARDLFEALQAMVLVHLAVAIEGHGLSVSIGHPDRVLEPFIDERFSADSATELVAAFMLKLTAHSFQGRGSKTQAITIGGADAHGHDRCNALTACFLDACALVRVGDPHVFLRWHPGMSPDIRERALGLLTAGAGMPLLVNDEPTVQGLCNAGITRADAWDYCIIGCNELGIPGRSASSAAPTGGTLQHLSVLNEMLLQHPAPDRIEGMGQLLALYEQHVFSRCLRMRKQRRQGTLRAARCVPTPFTSALMHECIARGQDLLTGMRYTIPCVYERGLTNAVNAFAAIEQLVFTRGSTSLSELVQGMCDNWADGRLLRMVRGAPKWGNDDPRADKWCGELLAA